MEQRVALITGGTRGIGLGIARTLARDGLRLALNGVRPSESVADVLHELEDEGADVAYFRADISRTEEREALLAAVLERFGRVHVLVNNAGMAPRQRADILTATEESFDEVVSTNLRGPHFLTQAVAKHMIEAWAGASDDCYGTPSACIVFVTSISAAVASVNRGEYCISKAGLSMASRLWAVRLAEFGIRVYEVRPGIIATDMTRGVHDRYDELIRQGLTLERRWGTPQDVGRVVAALVRDELPYATGSVVTVDGGLTVPRL